MRPVEFNREKFRELIVYIAEKTADDPSFGDTHLNKALYWSDFFGYSHLGRPVTGARYQKLQYGPAARALWPVREELREEGALHIEEQPAGSMKRRITVADRAANVDLFLADELELVDDVIGQVKGHSAGTISELSHRQSHGWNIVDIGDDIPYETALISNDQPSEETLSRGRELAARLGW